MTTSDTQLEVVIPADDATSRIRRAASAKNADAEVTAEDDVVTAEQRLKKFHRKYPDGSIVTDVDYVHAINGFTATARVFTGPQRSDVLPKAIAHATRTYGEFDPVSAARPQESAETSAIGRALRFLGIEPPKPRKPRKTAPPA